MTQDDSERNFKELLGTFGSRANKERRAKAERRAAMKPNDGRRKKEKREAPLNVRIRKSVHALAQAICEADNISQADLVERMVESLAKERGML